MSEITNSVATAQLVVEKKINDLKTETEKPIVNDVAITEVNNNSSKEAITPTAGRQRRKRASEIADISLVIATPSGSDSNRRQTRSQTRGTPAPTPAKKPALEKASSNGSAAKGRRGRPPKSANDDKPIESAIAEDVETEVKAKKPKLVAEKKAIEKMVEIKETKKSDVTDGSVISTSKGSTPKKVVETPFLDVKKVEKEPRKVEEAKVEKIVEKSAVNSQSQEKPKSEKPLVEKPVLAKQVLAKPVLAKPAVAKPLVEKPVVEKPLVTKPVVAKPVVDKPLVEKPLVEKLALEKLAVEKLTVEKSVTISGDKPLDGEGKTLNNATAEAASINNHE